MREVCKKNAQHYEQSFDLTKKEIYFLRLVLHNYATFEILDFLEIEIDHYFFMITSIKSKLKCESWYQAILKSFKNNILKHEDYIDDIIKEEAERYSAIIINKQDYSINKELVIESLIIEYSRDSSNKLKVNQTDKLNQDEEELIWLKYKGFKEGEILVKLNKNSSYLYSTEENVFSKLNVNNWFNTFKKAHLLETLIDEDNPKISISAEIKSTASKIISFFFLKNITDKEKQLMVYHELLNYYAKIQFNFLEQALI